MPVKLCFIPPCFPKRYMGLTLGDSGVAEMAGYSKVKLSLKESLLEFINHWCLGTDEPFVT